MAGKGSSPRPFSVSQDQFEKNFDAIFRRSGPEAAAHSEAEPDELEFRCTCGKPLEPGIVHRNDGPCYLLGGRA